MVQWIKRPLVILASHLGVSVLVLATLLPIQLPVKVFGKATDDVPSTWVPDIMWETRMELQTHGFSLVQSELLHHLGKEPVSRTSLSLSLSLSLLLLFQINP